MVSTKESIHAKYLAGLKAHMGGLGEKTSVSALELGREMVSAKISIEEISQIHEEALSGLSAEMPDMKGLETVRIVSEFLMELFRSYGLAHGKIMERLEPQRSESEFEAHSLNRELGAGKRTTAEKRFFWDSETTRERLDDIFKSMDDAVIVTDITKKIVLMNPAAENLLGVPLNKAREGSIASVIENTVLNEKIETALDNKTSGYHFVFKLPDDDSEYPKVMRVSTWRIKDNKDKETGIAINFVDISSERDMDLMRRELVSWIAHQVRTPLTSIQGFSEILVTRDDLKKEEKKEYLSHIYEQSIHLSKFIHKILDTSCGECGGGVDG